MQNQAIAAMSFYTKVPNEIIRHPRLSSDAKYLLTYALSLPDISKLSLWDVAKRAGMKKTAFTRAKRQLIAEGYVHEWRRQGPDGRWSTDQMLSNQPLTAEEALALRDGESRGDGDGHDDDDRPSAEAPADEAPAGENPADETPALGGPEPQGVGRSQEEKTGGKNPNRPHPLAERAAHALAAVSRGERRLRLSGRDILALAPLAAEWLSRGATLGELRTALTAGLPEVVHSPAGLTRNRLVRKMPDPAPVATAPGPRPQPLRSCGGGCGRVFRPVGDETACRGCRSDAAVSRYDVTGAVAATQRGMAAVRAALYAWQ